MAEETFFGGEPNDAQPPADDADFTMVNDEAALGAEAPAYAGDIDETGMDTGFAGAPADDVPGFAAPPSNDFGAMDEPMASSDAPIVLGGPPPATDDMDGMDGMMGMPDAPPPVLVEDVEPENLGPSPMQQWNEEWAKTLQARKEEENSSKAKMIEDATTEMEAFQKKREMAREKRMAKNREDEQAKLEAIEADLENDNSWQRVCKMVELSHDSSGNSEDTKRMRDLLILLKNEPTRAQEVGA